MIDRRALKDYEEWQRLSERATRFEYCQRMSAIEVGYNLGLIDSNTKFALSVEAIVEQSRKENAAGEVQTPAAQQEVRAVAAART